MIVNGNAVTLHGLDVEQFAAGHVVREWQYANGAEALAALVGKTVAVP